MLLAIVLVGVIVPGAYAIIINAADLLTFFITVWYALTYGRENNDLSGHHRL